MVPIFAMMTKIAENLDQEDTSNVCTLSSFSEYLLFQSRNLSSTFLARVILTLLAFQLLQNRCCRSLKVLS